MQPNISKLYKAQHHIQISTHSPIAIGDNEAKNLSPYADYVFSDDGKDVLVLDDEILNKAVFEANLTDDFVEGIYAGMDNGQSAFDLKNQILLNPALKFDIETLTSRKLKCGPGTNPNKKQVIEPFIKDAGYPFIPGSSLKGALKTIIIFDWFKNSKSLAKEGIIYSLKNTINPKVGRPIIPKGFFKDLENKWEDIIFGNLRDQKGHRTRHLKVADTNTGINEDLKLYSCKRIWLDDSHLEYDSTIPQLKEVIFQEKTHFKSSIKIQEDFKDSRPQKSDLNPWLDYPTNTVFEKINNWSMALIQFELSQLEKALLVNNHFNDEINALIEFYRNLEQKINDGECFLKIGNSKSILATTLAIILADKNDFSNVYKYFEVINYEGKKPLFKDMHPHFFPNTRVITMDNQPLGWVKLES